MQADYVVVGAGSGGCAVAYRLAEAGHSVIVVEFGGSDWGPFIRMPGALSYPMNMAQYDWGYRTEPEPHMNGRVMAAPRGKVIGGSSSINGMIFVRGHARDFDTWAQMGAQGWSHADVLPYFKRMETWHGPKASRWRGGTGPVHVTRGARANPLYHAFVEAGRQAGYEVTDDYNGEKQEGFGAFEQTVYKGRRWSAADAYLKPALRRYNLRLVQGLAQRILIEKGRAVGVTLQSTPRVRMASMRSTSPHIMTEALVTQVRARREVILAASAFNTPKLLMLSGIGPGEHLSEHGIPVIANRPGVGANLQDHLEVYFQMRSSQPITLYRYWNLLGKAWVGARWLLSRTGPGATNNFESCGFIRSRAGVEYPDIQFHFLPIAVRYDGKMIAEGHGFQAHVGPMRSPSRGTVRLKSADPAASPEIRFNYMSTPEDWADFRRTLRLTREIFQQDAFKPYSAGELLPGAQATSDEDLDAFVREHGESAYHPCGTCRMGDAADPNAVVDPEARVIGIEGLRVADSSIFPQVPNGNLNAPSIMVGEKVAAHILGQTLPRDEVSPWIHPNWSSEQR
ncbi:MAG: choline dehydrogenase [Pseudomonadota bacterium]